MLAVLRSRGELPINGSRWSAASHTQTQYAVIQKRPRSSLCDASEKPAYESESGLIAQGAHTLRPQTSARSPLVQSVRWERPFTMSTKLLKGSRDQNKALTFIRLATVLVIDNRLFSLHVATLLRSKAF